MTIGTWWLFVGVVFVVSATPGPNMLHIMQRSVQFGVLRSTAAMAGCMTAVRTSEQPAWAPAGDQISSDESGDRETGREGYRRELRYSEGHAQDILDRPDTPTDRWKRRDPTATGGSRAACRCSYRCAGWAAAAKIGNPGARRLLNCLRSEEPACYG